MQRLFIGLTGWTTRWLRGAGSRRFGLVSSVEPTGDGGAGASGGIFAPPLDPSSESRRET